MIVCIIIIIIYNNIIMNKLSALYHLFDLYFMFFCGHDMGVKLLFTVLYHTLLVDCTAQLYRTAQ